MTANERLKKIAEFFNPLASRFILENIHSNVNSALDLGCGPGYTTDMLANSTCANIITGIDFSDKFLDSARRNYPDYKFINHDVRSVPLPVKADIIYFRFLLSHLKDIRLLIEGWLRTLNPGGFLVLDELENIYTDNEVFKKYLSINDGLINSQGANLYVGKILDKELEGMNLFRNVSTLIPVKDFQAASWFFPNTISVWEDQDWVKKALDESERKRISKELLEIIEQKSEKSSITWRMRKIIIQQ